MRLCRFNDNRIGLVRGNNVHDVSSILDHVRLRYPLPHGDALIAQLPELRSRLEVLADSADGIPVDQVSFRSPIANPSKIIGTPANYRDHVAEADRDTEISQYKAARSTSIEEQGLFLKAVSALVGPADGVTIRFPNRRTDHEAELGVVIGRIVSNLDEKAALSAIAGYAIALDMVIRGPEDRSFRKSLDSFAVLGPWLVSADEIADPTNLNFELDINGTVRQKANTRDMIISIARQIAWASSYYTLYPGDIIMTGTCAGVGPVQPGDTMTIRMDSVGMMSVPVRAAGGK